MQSASSRRFLVTAVTSIALMAGSAIAAPGAQAASPYERGPNPTTAILDATRGPFATAQQSVSSLSVSGFGGGVIYYPTSTSEGTFGAVAISPGLHRRLVEHQLARPADRLARLRGDRHRDQLAGSTSPAQPRRPAARRAGLPDRAQLGAHPDRRAAGSPWPGTRWAAAARLEAATRPARRCRPPCRWRRGTPTKTWSSLRVPTLIIGGESDSVAPVSSHSDPVLQQHPGVGREGVPGAQQRQPLLPADRPTRPPAGSRWPGSSGSSTTTPATTSSCARARPAAPSRTTATPARCPDPLPPKQPGRPTCGRPGCSASRRSRSRPGAGGRRG